MADDLIINRRQTNWIDWMKTLGMFLIILGHLSPHYLNNGIYTFSVPAFYAISGFLFRTVSWQQFWKKNLRGIIIPYMLLCCSLILFFALVKSHDKPLDISYFFYSIIACLVGDQNGINCGIGCQTLWFVYTLFLAKVLVNILKDKWGLHVLTSIFFLYIAYILKNNDLKLYSSFTNLLVSYPFFIIGYLLKIRYKDRIFAFSKTVNDISIWNSLLGIIILLAICHIIGYFNGMTEMYNAGFGNSTILFILGGGIGTFSLAFIAMLLDRKKCDEIILLYSKGTILVLAWQFFFIVSINVVISRFIGEFLHNDILAIILAVCIYIAFIPIIKMVNKYFPILVGYRR